MIEKMVQNKSWGNKSSGLLVLRIGLAAVFIMAGWMKVSNLDATVAGFASMGLSSFWAYVVSFTELIAGIALLLGVYTRLAAALLAIVMISATVLVHKDFTLLLHISATLALVLSGGGKYSLMRNSCGCGTCNKCVNTQTSSTETHTPVQI
jgi:putative oxidoreductase